MDLEHTDVAGALHVGTTAQLAAAADVEHAHLVAVLFAEQHHRAELLRIIHRQHASLVSALARISAFTKASTCVICASVTGAFWARSRSACVRHSRASPSAAHGHPALRAGPCA
jgi:hypothetical protein